MTPRPTSPRSAVTASSKTFKVSEGVELGPQKIIVYGTGGSGKTSLCASLKDAGVRPLIIDVGEGSGRLPVARIGGHDGETIETWEDLRSILHTKSLWNSFGAVVLDDLTKAEELCADYVMRTVPCKGGTPKSIEDYPYGKGPGYVFDNFLSLIGDLDAIIREDIHVVGVAHECIEKVPNAEGEDWIQWQPRLQAPRSGKDSIRHRIVEWADHVLFVGYDVAVENGKGTGAGTRTIYTSERPSWKAKSRATSDPILYPKGGFDIWNIVLKGTN